MKFVYAVLVLLVLVVAALFIVPSVLDWERFKPEITERLEAITGREIAIDGALAVSILPTPTIKAADLRIANAPGAVAPDMARIASLDLTLALGPLLGGKIAVTSLEMVEPVIELQRLADGRPNWLFETEPDPTVETSANGEPEAAALGLTRIDSATITNGTIVYRHADDEPPARIEGIDAAISARSLDGPFRGEGNFVVRGRAIGFQLATGTVGEDRTLPVSFEATFGGERGNALFEGILNGIDGMPAFDGSVRSEAPDFGALLNALAVDLGSLPAAPLGSGFSAKGEFSVRADTIAARELQVRLGESQANGTLSWQGGDVPRLAAEIDLNRIDLDRFLPDDGKPKPAGSAGSGSEPQTAEAAGSDGAGQPGSAEALATPQSITDDIRREIPTKIDAALDLTIGALTWRKGVIRKARARLALENGVVTIRQTSALLPGGADVDLAGQLTANGNGQWMEGVGEIEAEDLRATLSWLGVDVGAIPADRLRRLSASADLSASGDRLSASNLDIRVDTTRIAGNVSIETSERPQIAADLAVDAVNADAYLLDTGPAPSRATGDADAAPQEAAQPTPGRAGGGAWPVLDEIDADVALKIDALTYGGVRLAELEFDAALDHGGLNLRRASVADAAGANILLSGTGSTVGTAPSFDLAVEGAADSLDGVLALLDIDPDIRAEAFGKVTLNGTLAGDEEALSIDLALAAGAAQASLTGTVEQPLGAPAAALLLNLRAEDAASLARTVGLTPPPIVTRLGALALEGGIGGDLASVAINMSVETAGATLQIAGKVTDPLASPSYSIDVDLAHPRGEALVETLVGDKPADAALGAMRLAGKVSGDGTVASFADIDAMIGDSTLTGGVFLRLDQEPPGFSADLHGGVLDLAWLGGGLTTAGETEAGGAPSSSVDLAGTGTEGAAPQPARWSDETIDLAVLDRLSGTLALDAEALLLGAYRIEQAEIDLAAAEGTLTLHSLTGRLFDGALKADGSLAGGPVPAGQAAFRLTDAELGPMLREIAGVDAVSGRAEVDGYFTLRGQTVREMMQSLSGRVALAASEGAVEGVDVPAISRQIDALSRVDTLDDIASFVDGTEQSLSNGRTAIRSLDGTVRVQDGQARIDGFEIVAEGGVGEVSGTADVPAWQLDLTALFRLTGHADAPPVGIRLEGPINRPERRYLIADMQAHLVKLGLLSLAGVPDMPKITLRKGAKAEPGTEMDTLLRNVLGDPDKAEDTGTTDEPDEPEERAGAGEPSEAVDDQEEDGAGGAAPSPGDGLGDAAVATEPVEAIQPEETAGAEQREEVQEPLETGGEEEREAAPPTEAPAPEEPVPEPPPAPARDKDEDLQDLVDDLLKSLEE